MSNEIDTLGWDFVTEEEFFNDTPTKKNEKSQSKFTKENLTNLILSTLRSTLSSIDGMNPVNAEKLIQRIKASPKVLKVLNPSQRDLYDAVFEVLEYECTVASTGVIHLTELPILLTYKEEVREEFRNIVQEIGVSTPKDAHSNWHSLVELVQRNLTKEAAYKLAKAIEAGEPLSNLLRIHQDVEVPTTQKATLRTGKIKNAAELSLVLKNQLAGKEAVRFSSGLPTLDLGYTGKGEAKGFIAPGQFCVVMGPTGTGKSSFANSVTPAFGLDMLNWGLKDAYQVLFHTEEESIDKIRGFRMDANEKYHHLAKNIIVEAIGTSRKKMAEVLYDLVIDADRRSRENKRPITDFLPYIVQLDYLQSIAEPGETETEATARTAEFLLRGVVAWNPEEMSKFSGVDFRTYAGMSWPIGMENHRVAVLAYAQLVKVNDESLYYKPGKKASPVSDFALLDDKDNPLWDVKEGDLRIFGKNQMRGSGVVANNAHMIVILHRSVPYNNPAKKALDGSSHLTDTRARILFDKSRAGSRLSYAPMRFDVQSTGFRAQYFDEVAERALRDGRLKDVDPSYTESGDPILPARPKKSKLSAIKY